MNTTNLKVALVGDSVLDDHYWLKDPTQDVRAQLDSTLSKAYPSSSVEVLNYAVDESTVRCVLRGRVPGSHYQVGRRKAGIEPYPADADGVVRPLPLLRQAQPTYVVLSIGGNDARIRFLQSRDPDTITELMVADGLISNLRRLIRTIYSEICSKIILVYVFMPEYKLFPLLSLLPPPSILQRLLENFSKFYIELANEFCLPIVDLSRTFDPNNKEHYGSTPIEPSNISGQFIAELVAQVIEQFRFGQEAGGKIFSGVGERQLVQDIRPNEGFSYEQALRDFLHEMSTKKASMRMTCAIT